jgi:hypothetical protein
VLGFGLVEQGALGVAWVVEFGLGDVHALRRDQGNAPVPVVIQFLMRFISCVVLLGVRGRGVAAQVGVARGAGAAAVVAAPQRVHKGGVVAGWRSAGAGLEVSTHLASPHGWPSLWPRPPSRARRQFDGVAKCLELARNGGADGAKVIGSVLAQKNIVGAFGVGHDMVFAHPCFGR